MTETFISEEQTTVTSLRRVSWRAVLAGVVIAAIIQLLFSLLGVAIGAGMTSGQVDAATMTSGAGIWLIVSSVVSLFIGAYVAARLSGSLNRGDRMWHGVLTWGTGTLLSVIFLGSTTGAILGGATNMLRASTVSYMGHPQMDQQVSEQSPDQNFTPTGRDTTRADHSPAWISTREQSQSNGDTTRGEGIASRISQTAFWGFAVLALSGIAAALGGACGRLTDVMPQTHIHRGEAV